MKYEMDYIDLMDIAKMNLNKDINNAMELYKKEKNNEKRHKIIELLNDRKKLFLFDNTIIEKYL